MNADAFRHLYDYHFATNREVWDSYVMKLSDDDFDRASDYSHGSVRDQVVHLMNVDDAWFGDLRGDPPSADLPPDADGAAIRARWNEVEARMRDYLGRLRDDQLLGFPFTEGEDKDLRLWQILIHVVNHGTDHRAQLLRQLNDLGLKTTYQDYVFYAYGHPVS
jgi:uncharacterized damage-inducible protein DinB